MADFKAMTRTLQQDKKDSRLSELECPFNWNLQDLLLPIVEKVTLQLNLKLEKFNVDTEEDKSQDYWYKVCIKLLLAYKLKNERDGDGAYKEIESCEDLLKELKTEMKDSFLHEIIQALNHMVLATKAHIIQNSGEIKLLLEQIVPVTRMNNKELAGIEGIKAEVLLLLGHSGHKLAIPCAESAIRLNENEAHWWLLAGKAMGRVRRVKGLWTHDLIEKKELEYLKKAIALKGRPSYMVLLADAYREYAYTASNVMRDGKHTNNIKASIAEMNKNSIKLYKSVIKLGSASSSLMIRCAKGLVKLPPPYKDMYGAKKIVNRCLAMSPNDSFVHHVAADVYQLYSPFQNKIKALEHLEKASDLGNYPATLQKIRLKCDMDEMYDPYQDLKLMKQKFHEEHLQLLLEKEFGMYYLFKKRDLLSALKHFTVVIQRDKGDALKDTFISFYKTKRVNVLKIIVDETRCNINRSNPEDKEVMEKFLVDIKLRFPELMLQPVKPNQIEQIISEPS